MKRVYIAIFTIVVILFNCNPIFSYESIKTDFTKFNTKLVKGENLVTKTVFQEDGHSVVEFKYSDCKKGSRYLEFWLCPAKHRDGTFEEYSIRVNNVTQNFKIQPTKGDWQSVKLPEGKTVTFNDGNNTIQVISEGKSVPNVDFIEVSTFGNPININETTYKGFRANIASKGLQLKSKELNNYLAEQEENPLYDYSYIRDLNFNYTFYKSYYLEKNEWIEINVEGIDGYEAILYFFKDSNPGKFSWAQYPEEDGTSRLEVMAPEAGYYRVVLKPLWGTHIGFCNININEDEYFDEVPVSGINLFYKGDVNEEYNIFTVAQTGDPIVWIEEAKASETPSGYTTKICDFCDDGDEDGDYDWGINPRIKRIDTSKTNKIFVTSYSSNSPTGICDLYMGCKNASDYLLQYFPRLDPNDAIVSSKSTDIYNCISWSGGITSYWEWPGLPESQFYSEDILEGFDKFYDSRGLTRYLANSDNAYVALWAHVDSNGNRYYTHASVRRTKSQFLHGYDWESKPGSLERIFHPKTSLGGNSGYGQIVEYYSFKTRSADVTVNNVLDTTIIKEEYSENEQELIKNAVISIDIKTKDRFGKLYDGFKTFVESSPHSNPDLLIDCPEYKDMMSYYRMYPECKYLLFDKLGNNELPAILTLSKIISSDDNLNKIRKKVNTTLKAARNQANTYTPIQTNLMLVVKEYLESNANEIVPSSYLSDTDINIIVEADQIIIEMANGEEGPVNVELYDQYGNLINLQSNIQSLADNKYTFTNNYGNNSKGLYILKISTSNAIYTKKINL